MIDTHGEFVDRTAQMMPVKTVASAIDPARREPVQDFSENGQTAEVSSC